MDDKVLITNWSLPCPAKEASDGSFSMLTALSNAAGGTYPIGANGLWHGGIHFDKGTANSFDQSSVKCIADGEVIAYRIDASYPTTVYPGKPPMQTTAAFSTGFVLVKHTLQAPEKPTKPESGTAQTSADTATATPPPSITLFSLYMHLKDWKSYQADNKLAKPGFWGEGAEYAVKSDAKDAVLGLNARAGYTGQTGYSTIYGVIPRGVIVEASEASPDGRWLKVSSTTPNVPELTGDAWVYKGEMHSLGADRYLISEQDSKDKPATEILGLNVRATEHGGDIIAVLPRASVITISGTGRYRKLESIVSGISTPALIPAADGKLPGYVWFESLVADAKPKKTDSIVILDTPTAIKAGDLIGHIGTYQNNDGVDQQQLHVELFSCDDVPGFISKSRAWAASLADGQKTLLKIHKGASKLIAHHDGISETNPPKLTDAGTEVGVTLTIPQNLLDGLPATHKVKVSVPGTSGQPAEVTNWWRLENLLADKDGKPISGWLCEQELITTRHSPWEWEGYDYVEETGKPVEHVAYALDAMGMLDKQEQANYQTMINKVDGGPLTSAARVYEIIDSNKDDKLSRREITSALAKPWSAQALAQIITKYESEWFKNPAKWDELDDILTPEPSEPNLIWTAEKQRIEKLSWWDQLAGQQGLSADGKAWHFQVVGIITAHKNKKRCFCFEQGIVETPCQQGIKDVSKEHFELLAVQVGVEREVLRAIAVAETGDKVPFKEFVAGEQHALILYERHYMRRLLMKSGYSTAQVNQLSTDEPKIVHSYESSYTYGTLRDQYIRLLRARELDENAANMSCSWGKFQVMGEYYNHLYETTQELVEAQNYCALQHLQYFKVFLTEEKNMLGSMKTKDWKTIAEKYNGKNQKGYDTRIESAYDKLKETW